MPLKVLFEKWFIFIRVIPTKNTKGKFLTFNEYHEAKVMLSTLNPTKASPAKTVGKKKPLSKAAAYSHLGIEMVRYIAHF